MNGRDSFSDRELLIRIDERTEVMEGRLDNHGKRIGRVEKFQFVVTGGIALLVFLIVNFGKIKTFITN